MQVEDLAAALKAENPPFLLDVREPHELAIAALGAAVAIPLRQLPSRVSEIPSDKAVVVMCHHGGRSAQAVAWLKQNGHSNCHNLEGGIDAWSRRIDPAIPTY